MKELWLYNMIDVIETLEWTFTEWMYVVLMLVDIWWIWISIF